MMDKRNQCKNDSNKQDNQQDVTVCMEVAGAESIDWIDYKPQTIKSKR